MAGVTTASTRNLPGFNTPAVGFEQPFAMLEACHERVQRTLGLLALLRAHVHDNGVDDNARQAASDVLRYFDIAAPLHHQDEELHVFPLLLAHGSAAVVAQVQALQADHDRMAVQWQATRALLQALAGGRKTSFSAEENTVLARFAEGYGTHIRTEEEEIYPAARTLLDAQALQRMGKEMRQRRGAVD